MGDLAPVEGSRPAHCTSDIRYTGTCAPVGCADSSVAALCEARNLKFYATPGSVPAAELSDLFLDPDEKGHQDDPTSLVTALSNPSGGYANAAPGSKKKSA
jgi:hypothetical protein